LFGTIVYVDDAANVYVKDLTKGEIGKEDGDVVLNSNLEGVVWDNALDTVKKCCPDAVEKEILPLGGHTPTGKCRIDGI